MSNAEFYFGLVVALVSLALLSPFLSWFVLRMLARFVDWREARRRKRKGGGQ